MLPLEFQAYFQKFVSFIESLFKLLKLIIFCIGCKFKSQNKIVIVENNNLKC